MAATERMLCATENVNNNLLYVIASNALLSFDLSTKSWSKQMYTRTVLHRSTAGCAMDSTYSDIYIFGGISDSGSEYDPTVVQYTVTNDEWNTVPNALIMQQSEHIKCGLLPSDGFIRCVSSNILYSFDPLSNTMTHTRLSQNLQFYSMVGCNDSCIVTVGTDPIIPMASGTVITVDYAVYCPGQESPSVQALALPLSRSTQSTTDASTGHRRQLGSWSMIILNSSYTENLTLEAGNIYVVNYDVEVSASLIVADNATILFNGTSQLLVRGDLLMGTCSNDGTIGVSSNSIRVYNADTSTTRGVLIARGTGHTVSVCNTNFSHIFQFNIYDRSNALFSNLEFYGCHSPIYIVSGDGPETVRNSYFYEGTYGFRAESGSYGGGIVQNNIFERVSAVIQTSSHTNAYTIINNTFIGKGGDNALRSFANVCNNTFVGFHRVFDRHKFDIVSHNVFRDNDYVFYTFYDSSVSVVMFNDFIQNGYAVWMHSDYPGALDMKYNNFIANDVAIYFGKYMFQNVSYNNFINNSIIFDVHRSPAQPYCGHNYYGINTTNPWDIQTHIDDVCNGHVQRFYAQWWPWYNDKIDFDALPVQLTAYGDGLHFVDCRGPNLHPNVNGTQLSPIWLGDLVLTADKSPYYVIWDTRVNYNLIIEPSVELIFAGSYILRTTQLGGGVRIGESMCNDTMQYDGIGLYDANTAIHIRGSRFNIEYSPERAYICNTKVTGGSSVFNIYMIPGALIDNCEFNHISGYGVRMVYLQLNSTVRDTLFVDSSYGIDAQISPSYNPGIVFIEHNKFQDCTARAIWAYTLGPTLYIINNTFENHGTAIAVQGKGYDEEIVIRDNTFFNFETVFEKLQGGVYTGNVFINNEIVFDIGAYKGTYAIYHNEMINNSIAIQAIHQSSGYLDVKYNNFVDNNKAIIFLNGSPRLVQYNNFDDNAFNFEMQSAVDADCSRNWHGYAANIADPALIQDKILDTCTPNGQSGKVIFWPFFDGSLFLDDLANLPALYNLSTDYTGCASLDLDAVFVAGQPTRSPSSDAPTIDPTSDPTVQPSAPSAPPTSGSNAPSASPTHPSNGPTFYPTTHPTADPTDHPSTDPTNGPTVYPTKDPTHEPRIIVFDPSYTDNLTLRAGKIYVANGPVTISASLIVPDNVTILFNSTEQSEINQIKVSGHLLMGTCFNDGTIGVSSNSIRVHNVDTSGIPSRVQLGQLWAQSGAEYSVSVCNTNFSHIKWLRVDGRANLLFSNNEFAAMHTSIHIYSGIGPETVSNSYFHGDNVGSYGLTLNGGGCTVQNNIFDDLRSAIGSSNSPHTIINNTFISRGGNDKAIVTGNSFITVINNTFEA
eukprot:959634_1